MELVTACWATIALRLKNMISSSEVFLDITNCAPAIAGGCDAAKTSTETVVTQVLANVYVICATPN